ncbi:hypothetical protein JCM3774_001154 [Rhodotorula dairenensis]
MLSRLKRRAASTSNGDPPAAASAASSPSGDRRISSDVRSNYTASPPTSRPESPTRPTRPNRHSFATPVRTSDRAADSELVGRTLSPARAYTAASPGGGRSSRSSSISSHVPASVGRRSLTLPSPPGLSPQASAARAADIGHGSLSLDHLPPQQPGAAPLTLVVHAPELLPDGGGGSGGELDDQDWFDQGGTTPVMPPGSEQRTPLAPPRSLSVPSNGLAEAAQQQHHQEEPAAKAGGEQHRHRAMTTGDVRFIPPPPHLASVNGLDALAAINVPTGVAVPNQDTHLYTRRPYPPRSPSLSPEASRNGSRLASRRSSFAAAAADEAPLRRGRSATTTSSPSRGRSKSAVRNGTASPHQNLARPSSRGGHFAGPAAETGERHLYTALQEPAHDSSSHHDGGSAPAMSARNSLESHISPYLTANDTEDFQEYRSAYGDNGTGFLSMDHFGDFDDVVSQLGTGYAVASSKRNADFHALFKHIPDDDYLIEDYGCALQREILIQGRLYISEHHLSFNANIFGWVTSLTIPFSEVVSIEKRMTAYVIPNAIQITTLHARHVFASFLSRDTTYDLIGSIWRMVHPVVPMSAALPDSMSAANHSHIESDDEVLDDEHVQESVVNVSAVDSGSGTGGERRVRDRARRKLKGLSGRRRGGTDATDKSTTSVQSNGDKGVPTQTTPRSDKDNATGSPVPQMHAPTVDTCPTLKNLKEICLDTVFPGKPEKIYNLMFTSGFMKNFWAENQKLTEIQIGDWAPQSSGSNLLARSMSYIKPLYGSIGPRQTKCLITDESAHVDFDDFVCVITTTRTPDVPSGSAFAVKTRTSMTWAKGNKCRVVVTTGVEWSKSSFIKGIIEKSAIEGQKQYHSDLEKAMRAYIATHRNEFVEEGQDPDAPVAPGDSQAEADESTAESEADEAAVAGTNTSAGSPPHAGALGALWSCVEPVLQALAQQSPTSLALGAVVAILLLSNLWTLRGRNDAHSVHPAERARRHVLAGRGLVTSANADGAIAPPDDVANAVRDVLNNYFAAAQASLQAPPVPNPAATASATAAVPTWESQVLPAGDTFDAGGEDAEIQELAELLDRVEERARRLRAELAERRKASETAIST